MLDFRLMTGAIVATMAIILIGLRLFGAGDAVAGLVRGDTPRIETSIMEKRLPMQQRMPVPVWSAPAPVLTPAIEPVAAIDTEQAASVASAAVPSITTAESPEPALISNDAESISAGIEDAAANVETAAQTDTLMPENTGPEIAAKAAESVAVGIEDTPAEVETEAQAEAVIPEIAVPEIVDSAAESVVGGIEDAVAEVETAAQTEGAEPENAGPDTAASADPATQIAETDAANPIDIGKSSDTVPVMTGSIGSLASINAPPEPLARPAQIPPVKRRVRRKRVAARPVQAPPAQPRPETNPFAQFLASIQAANRGKPGTASAGTSGAQPDAATAIRNFWKVR